MSPSSRRLVGGFFIAFALTLGSFVCAAAYVRNKARAIGSAAESIAQNASLSVQRLALMQSDIRRLEVSVDDALDVAETRQVALTLGSTSWSEALGVLAEWSAYATLPHYSGEQPIALGIIHILDNVNGAMTRF